MTEPSKLSGGQRLGQWTLKGEKALGAGGNGEVWLAENTKGTKAALKFLHIENIGTKRATRFQDEILFLMKEKDRPGILPLIDTHTPDDRPWFSTPFANCFNDLKLAGSEKLPQLVGYIEAVVRTLVNLHQKENWHRDLKPENLFILDDVPVIGDFGLVSFPEKQAKTSDSEAVGTRNYTAPELEANAEHKPADKADVYSLSKTLWVLASGQLPPQGTLRMDDSYLQFSRQCRHPRAFHFDGLLERGTKYNPDDRPSMLEFARELSEWLNPPTTEALKTDFTALSKEYENVFEVADRERRNRDALIASAKAILVSFEPVLKQIAARIKDCTKIETYVGSAHDLEKHQFKEFFRGVRLVSRDTKGVRVTSGKDWAAFLQSFVQVEALDNDTIRVVAGHLVETTAHGRRFYGVAPIWIKEAIASRGSAQLANESETFRAGLLNNLNPAISAFGESVKKLPQ